MAVKKKGAKQPNRAKYHRRGGGILQDEAGMGAVLGENARTIRSWWHAGVIPGIVIGHRTLRFRVDDVLAALAKRTVQASLKDRSGTS